MSDRIHFTNASPVEVFFGNGDSRVIGDGWLAITETEYAELTSSAPPIKASVSDAVIVDEGRRYTIPMEQFSTLMAHGFLAKDGDTYRFSTEEELWQDPASAGVNNNHPLAVISIVRAGFAASPLYLHPPASGSVSDEAVEAAEVAAYGRHERGFIHKPLIGAIDMRAALTAALPFLRQQASDRIEALELALKPFAEEISRMERDIGVDHPALIDPKAVKSVLVSDLFRARNALKGGPKRWRHVKRGTTYIELGRAIWIDRVQGDDGAPLEFEETSPGIWTVGHNTSTDGYLVGRLQCTKFPSLGWELVVYRAESDNSLWGRPTAEFMDGRFERIPA